MNTNEFDRTSALYLTFLEYTFHLKRDLLTEILAAFRENDKAGVNIDEAAHSLEVMLLNFHLADIRVEQANPIDCLKFFAHYFVDDEAPEYTNRLRTILFDIIWRKYDSLLHPNFRFRDALIYYLMHQDGLHVAEWDVSADNRSRRDSPQDHCQEKFLLYLDLHFPKRQELIAYLTEELDKMPKNVIHMEDIQMKDMENVYLKKFIQKSRGIAGARLIDYYLERINVCAHTFNRSNAEKVLFRLLRDRFVGNDELMLDFLRGPNVIDQTITLPVDIRFKILRELEYNEAISLGKTCKKWYRLFQEDYNTNWKTIFKESVYSHSPPMYAPKSPMLWHHVYGFACMKWREREFKARFNRKRAFPMLWCQLDEPAKLKWSTL